MNNNLTKRIENLVKLGEVLRNDSGLDEVIAKAAMHNPWFKEDFSRNAIQAISDRMLTASKLYEWLSKYDIGDDSETDKTVGIIMAGNLPLVGFHDFLCVYILGYKIRIKLSGKDEVLFPYIVSKLSEIDASLPSRLVIAERLEGYDAVIATGSNNSHRYFEYYFRNVPKILRKNRNSVAVLDGNETADELHGLADDIFMYFGFGCRNVSKIYVPEGYDVRVLFPYFDRYKWMHQHTKYMNNYDYNRTLLLMNSTQHLADEIITLQENTAISSPVAVVYYETYNNLDVVKVNLAERRENIQCIVMSGSMMQKTGMENSVKLGQTQQPELWDYADAVDTINFLISLKSLV
jgi:hypothetical protein